MYGSGAQIVLVITQRTKLLILLGRRVGVIALCAAAVGPALLAPVARPFAAETFPICVTTAPDFGSPKSECRRPSRGAGQGATERSLSVVPASRRRMARTGFFGATNHGRIQPISIASLRRGSAASNSGYTEAGVGVLWALEAFSDSQERRGQKVGWASRLPTDEGQRFSGSVWVLLSLQAGCLHHFPWGGTCWELWHLRV